jgi:RNA polymerase-binding protein DksA
MARSTPKSLAGSAAKAAKKVIGRSSSKTTATKSPAKKATSSAATKAPAKKATSSAAKKAPAKKAAATQAPATKTTAKKATAKKATAKKAPAKKAPAKKAAAKKAPAKKTAAAKAPAKKAPASKAPAPAKKAPAKKAAVTKKAATTTTAKKAPAMTKKTTAGKATSAARARKAPASALVVKPDESAWTKAELDEVLTDLHDHRDKLLSHLQEAERELAGLMRDAGDGAGHDQADMGASSFERDHEITVVNNERDMLAQTDRALARIDDGTYGVCESCGEPIGKMRLMAFPRATLCMSCKQREERR